MEWPVRRTRPLRLEPAPTSPTPSPTGGTEGDAGIPDTQGGRRSARARRLGGSGAHNRRGGSRPAGEPPPPPATTVRLQGCGRLAEVAVDWPGQGGGVLVPLDEDVLVTASRQAFVHTRRIDPGRISRWRAQLRCTRARLQWWCARARAPVAPVRVHKCGCQRARAEAQVWA